MRLLGTVLLLMLALAGPALAVSPSEILADPALEARARAISAELRCLVCQNQSIDDSDADLARELRVIVRERVAAGDSDETVKRYIVDRYGEFVLLRPVLGLHTLVLWGAAPLLLLVGALGIGLAMARRGRGPTEHPREVELSEEERTALSALENSPNRPSLTES